MHYEEFEIASYKLKLIIAILCFGKGPSKNMKSHHF